jgi:hypothetical protein
MPRRYTFDKIYSEGHLVSLPHSPFLVKVLNDAGFASILPAPADGRVFEGKITNINQLGCTVKLSTSPNPSTICLDPNVLYNQHVQTLPPGHGFTIVPDWAEDGQFQIDEGMSLIFSSSSHSTHNFTEACQLFPIIFSFSPSLLISPTFTYSYGIPFNKTPSGCG